MWVRSTPTGALEALLGIGTIQNRISVQDAKVLYRVRNANGFELVKRFGQRALRSADVPGMPSVMTPRIVLFENMYMISLFRREDLTTSTA